MNSPNADELFQSKMDQLRQATREANQVLTDLKQARRDCEKYIQLEMKHIDNRLLEEAQKLIDSMGKATKQAVDEARVKIYGQFDKLAAILMGEDHPLREPLYELAIKKREQELKTFRTGLSEG
jgi:hypothetical protein